MAKKTTTTIPVTLEEKKLKLAEIRLAIKAGKEKNTNAHKELKREIARQLTKSL